MHHKFSDLRRDLGAKMGCCSFFTLVVRGQFISVSHILSSYCLNFFIYLCLKVTIVPYYYIFILFVLLFLAFIVRSILHFEHVDAPCLVVTANHLEIILMILLHQGASYNVLSFLLYA